MHPYDSSYGCVQVRLPVLHQHSDFELDGELVFHLDRYHGGVSEQADQVHWHFMLPRQRGDQGDQPEQSPPLDAGLCYLAAPGAVVSSAALESFELEQQVRDWNSAVSCERRPASHCRVDHRQLQPSLRPPVRLCALLCVIRC